jgi:molecular chaperone DnaJ
VSIKVRSHPVFTRDGDNVRVVIPVTFAEAVLGAIISVPVLGGEPVKLKVAPGTPNGRTLRVKGKGVQHETHQGDLLASVDILVPNRISKKAEEALRAFDSEIPVEDPRATLISRAGLL